MVKCAVTGCPNRSDGRGPFSRPARRFFSFPEDRARVKVWLAALRETERRDSTERRLICEDHFLSDHITARGVSDDAIPIMPPYLDGPLGLVSPWDARSEDEEEDEEEEEEEAMEDEEETRGQQHRPNQDGKLSSQSEVVAPTSPPTPSEEKPQKSARHDVSLSILTKRFLELMLEAPDGVLDLRQVAMHLQTRKRRVYDITNVLDGIRLIKKESASKIKWIGKTPVSNFVGQTQRFQKEMGNLKIVEERLDVLIKTCAQQLFDMTDNTENIGSAYVTHEDISHIKVFEEQTVIVIKAPEETKLEVPTPKEDSIQVHLKGGKGPIKVLTCEMGRRDESLDSQSDDKTGCFLTLEESRIKTAPLHTEASAPQSAVQSA